MKTALYHLFFHMHLRQSSDLLEGRLILLEDGKLVDTYIATSGCPGCQHKLAQDDKGKGPLPSNYGLGLDCYTVMSAPIDLSGTKGVEGNFYKINPHTVKIAGIERGDFGIHFDANAPGSAGCIVLRTPKGWTEFKHKMRSINQEILPLIVSYS